MPMPFDDEARHVYVVLVKLDRWGMDLRLTTQHEVAGVSMGDVGG